MNATTVADRLKQVREMGGMSARGLSIRAGLHPHHVGVIELRKTGEISATVAVSLARALGVSVEWLVNGEGDAPDKDTVLAAFEAAEERYNALRSAKTEAAA